MQKWEYLYVGFLDKKYAINGVFYSYQANENRFTLANRLGKEGWELVCMSGNNIYLFKRPIE